MLKPRKLVAVALLLVSCVFWFYSIWSASNIGFFENQLALLVMVLGGAVSMVGGSFAALWE